MSVYLLKILTPEKKLYESNVVSLTVTCADGGITVLAGHTPMTAALSEGPLVIKTEQEIIKGVAGRGVLQVGFNKAAVMVHSFKWFDNEVSDDTAPEEVAESDILL